VASAINSSDSDSDSDCVLSGKYRLCPIGPTGSSTGTGTGIGLVSCFALLWFGLVGWFVFDASPSSRGSHRHRKHALGFRIDSTLVAW
jgi:hypothetical protein